MKEKFTRELKILSDNNVELQIFCNALQNKITVLETVEKKSISDEIEVDGVFVSGTTFSSMMSEVAQAGHNMWEMIQKRLITVMQRPYPMIEIRDQKQEEENLSMELDGIKLNYDRDCCCKQAWK